MTTKPGALGNSSSRQIGFAIVKALISIALLYTLFQAYDIEAALKRLAGVDWGFFDRRCLLWWGGFAAWRWRIMLGIGRKFLAKTASSVWMVCSLTSFAIKPGGDACDLDVLPTGWCFKASRW